MDAGIVDSDVQLIQSPKFASEFDVLGMAIQAHLLALRFGGFIRRSDLEGLARHTIRMYGHLYSANSRRMIGYRQAWVGKAFEYAVTELANRRSEPYWTLIRAGIDQAVCTNKGSRVRTVDIDIDRLTCIRVCKECADVGDLIQEFRAFRILRDARVSLEGAAQRFPGLEEKVDVLFCERDQEGPRFAVTASLKVNREAFLSDRVRRDFQQFPLDLGITVETPRYREVRFDAEVGAHIVHLPMHMNKEIDAWEITTTIVEQALLEGERAPLVRWVIRFFRSDTPGHFWLNFLADRLEVEMDNLLDEIKETLSESPLIRSAVVPVLLGPREDAVLDLTA